MTPSSRTRFSNIWSNAIHLLGCKLNAPGRGESSVVGIDSA